MSQFISKYCRPVIEPSNGKWLPIVLDKKCCYSNQHLSESYLLYRAAYADMLQYRFLDYMLQKLNNGFEPLRQEFGFVGRIITPLPRINYSQHLAEYHDGKINASQLGDVILKKNLRN